MSDSRISLSPQHSPAVGRAASTSGVPHSVLLCASSIPATSRAGQWSLPIADVNAVLILAKQGMGYDGKVTAKRGFVFSCLGIFTVVARWWCLQGSCHLQRRGLLVSLQSLQSLGLCWHHRQCADRSCFLSDNMANPTFTDQSTAQFGIES